MSASIFPSPKPAPRPVKEKKRPARKVRVKRKNVARYRAEFARCFHSLERVLWVKAQPCAWCVLRGRVRMCGPTDNAHTESYAGTGRRGGYKTIAPLGRYHHVMYDNYAEPFDSLVARYVVKTLAERTESLWRRVDGGTTE